MKNLSVYFLLLIVLLSSCADFKYNVERSEQAILVHFDQQVLQVEVIDEDIIHIKKYLPTERIIEKPDFVTVLAPQDVKWKLKEKTDHLTLITPKMQVVIKDNGTINYYTTKGEKILNELAESTVLNTKENSTYEISQAFEVGHEGLYGLGQYQSGRMNWKNVPLRMEQFNQEIVVPFLVSTNNYGIYWHNYSVTDFNRPENKISFSEVVDKEKNIRASLFTPKQTGVYNFLLDNTVKGNRKNATINLIIDTDTILHYSTIWAPNCFSGEKYLEAGKEYQIVLQNTGCKVDGQLLYNAPDYNKTVFSSRKGKAVDYYLINGNTPTDVIAGYRRLTGQAPMFPKSAFGFWQCRERYHNQAELLENAHEYRQRKIPVDNIVQDWFYWPKGTKGPQWDNAKYPNPRAMVKELKSLHMKLMVSVWPQVINAALLKKYNLTDFMFEEGNNVDIYNEAVQKRYYQMLSDAMFHIGVASIWLDGTEPESKPDDQQKTAAGPFEEVANPYSLLVNKAMYEGRRNEFPEERVFNLTRSAYAGQQRYGAASWSGDVAATWEQFSEQIAAGLNFTMAGIPYWTTDIGGFFRDSKSLNPIYDDQYTNPEYIELLTRWFQFGAFNPIFRIHGYVSNTEIWRYGAEFESTARKFLDLRYQLLPYIYTEASKVTNEGKLLMSPLVYYYPNDDKTWGIKDQFFLGKGLMVCPVTEYKARTKEVYLPEGIWYNYWTNEKFEGGKMITTSALLNEVPLFVKAGTILVLGPKVQYATEKTGKALRVKVYPGKDNQYTLYSDDNESYDYEKGEFSEININYSDANQTISMTQGKGQYRDYSKEPQKFFIEIIGSHKIEKLFFEGNK